MAKAASPKVTWHTPYATYLKYQNRRAEYVNDIFNIIKWDNVASGMTLPAHRSAA